MKICRRSERLLPGRALRARPGTNALWSADRICLLRRTPSTGSGGTCEVPENVEPEFGLHLEIDISVSAGGYF